MLPVLIIDFNWCRDQDAICHSFIGELGCALEAGMILNLYSGPFVGT